MRSPKLLAHACLAAALCVCTELSLAQKPVGITADLFSGTVGHSGTDLQMAALSMAMGGHVRAGFEDNPYYRPGELATSNAQLIERLVRLANEIGREVVAPAEARELLGLQT